MKFESRSHATPATLALTWPWHPGTRSVPRKTRHLPLSLGVSHQKTTNNFFAVCAVQVYPSKQQKVIPSKHTQQHGPFPQP